MLCEGLSIRATERLSGTDQKTIIEMLLLVGQWCKLYMENAIINVPVEDVSVDEPRCGSASRKARRFLRPAPCNLQAKSTTSPSPSTAKCSKSTMRAPKSSASSPPATPNSFAPP